MRLSELQLQFAAATMTPLTRFDGMASTPATRQGVELIKPNRRMSSRERLEVYAHSYWFRVLDAFRDDFPGLARVLGRERFERMARRYLAATPSRCFTLRNLGSKLPEWMENRPGYGRLAVDMARLEWAHVVAFDGAERKPLAREETSALRLSSRVALQPNITLIAAQYPVDEMRLKPRRRANRHSLFIAVHRVDLNVHYRRLDEEEYRVLSALRDGTPIGRAIEGVESQSLRLWFAAWARFGWLTQKQS